MTKIWVETIKGWVEQDHQGTGEPKVIKTEEESMDLSDQHSSL